MGTFAIAIAAGIFGIFIGVIAAGSGVSQTRDEAVARCIDNKITLEQCASINGWVE